MKEVQDRVVQFSNRYKLTNAETSEVLGTFDFDEVTGTVQQVGTEIDAELFDSIANDLAKRVRVDAKQNFSAGQKQQARANIDAAGTSGTYENFISGGVQCAQLYNNADLNDCVPENDKVFQAWVCTGGGTSNTMSNTPFANFGRTFYLTAVKTWNDAQDNNKFRVVQTLYSVATGGVSQNWTRAIDGSGTLGWSDWKEIVVADGSYPTLGAGYLAKWGQANVQSSDTVGWHKFASVPLANLTAISGASSYSCIILVNGINPYAGSTPLSFSGEIEIDIRVDNAQFSTTPAQIKAISGYIDVNNVCYVKNTNSIDLYIKLSTVYERYAFTVKDERYYGGKIINAIEFSDTYYGTSAPSGAVYAVVRNRASADADGNELVNTSTEQTISGRKNFAQSGADDPIRVISAWEKTGNSTTRYNYIEFLDSNNSRTGVIGQKTAGTDRYGVYLQCGSEGSLQVLSDGENVYFLLSKNPPATDNTTSIATTKWVNDKGYLKEVPVASETVFGGAKMWVDGGKLYIKTE